MSLTLSRAEAPAAERALLPAPWCEPLAALAPVADEPYAFALLSDGSPQARWSYVGRAPRRRLSTLDELRSLLANGEPAAEGPPFQGGAVGLAGYEFGATLEVSAPQARRGGWPDLAGGVYDSLLAFDHHERRVWAVGRSRTREGAAAQARAALALREGAAPVNASPRAAILAPLAFARDYPEAVEAVLKAIAGGEIFQANIARGWGGALAEGARPFDVLAALAEASPAPFAGYLRLPGRAVVSNSPERFLSVSPEGLARTQPIKGTRPRGLTRAEDEALAAELLSSAKDRAENLMIVDLMRNDLSRACTPGSVEVKRFCALESFANVHHLVSTVTGRLAPGRDALDLFAAAFPPGSVTGAPKLQAQAVIARHEPPRGPYCGSLFWAGEDGAFDSNVLIRTLACEQDAGGGWRFETRAGAGITADSDPRAEDAEALAKIAAIRRALGG